MKKVVLTVPMIDCEHCEHAVVTALNPLAGVNSVKVDIEAKLVHLEFDESQIDLTTLKNVLKEEDYPVTAVATFR